jgi:RNA-directed DNA polymerase
LNDDATTETIEKIHNSIITSFSARAMAVRHVTSNAGRKTAGVDKKLWTTDEQKYEAIEQLKVRASEYNAKPVKRV